VIASRFLDGYALSAVKRILPSTNPPKFNFASARYILRALILIALAGPGARAQTPAYARPEFAEPNRKLGVESALPEVDRVFGDLARAEHFPGLVYGVVLDGELIHSRALGFANLERQLPAASDSAFRVASMTKSFVALAIFKLRDDGRLSLDDLVEKHLPEFRNVRPPSADSPRVTIRNLMTMTTGLPEDNPWGDRQMAITKEALQKFVRGGLSFSNPPGQQYEYSNLGFVLLGQIVSQASGMPFQKYITTRILQPLGMTHTRWEYADVPADKLALGYRWEHDAWTLEPILHDGEGAACGGLITTLDDFAKYVEFHLNVWPARDEADHGPIRRATVRELQRPFVFSGMSPKDTLLDGVTPNPGVGFYGFGLGWYIDSRRVIALAHSGGLPGYGSNYRFLPDYGLAVIAFANRTYAPVSPACRRAVDILLERGHLRPRVVPPSAILATRAGQLRELIRSWDPRLCDEIVADNFFLDQAREDRIKNSRETLARAGRITSTAPVVAENQLRGAFTMSGEWGNVKVHFTLTPENVPRVQALDLTFTPKP